MITELGGPATIEPAVDPGAADVKKNKLFTFEQIKSRLDILTKSEKKSQAEQNRKLRVFDIEPEALRASGDIQKDETMVAIRTINTNIEREQPPFINFLRNSRRIVTFSAKEGKDKLDTQQIEEEFTRGMTYSGWEIPIYQELDGSQTHGYDAVEVIFDESKPFHVAIDHIGYDQLHLPEGSVDIQSHECLMREYSYTPSELESFILDFDFDETQVKKVLEPSDTPQKRDTPLSIFKVFIKWEKQIYVAWANFKYASDWLKAPQLHYVGWDEQVEVMVEQPPLVQQIQTGVDQLGLPIVSEVSVPQPPMPTLQWQHKALTMFPIFLLKYKLTEQKQIDQARGRAYLDAPKQEALTALWSSFVNGANRAATVFASPENQSGSGGLPKQLDVAISSGMVWSEPLQFWSPPYPDESLIRAAQNLETQNSQEIGQVNFAVQNRKGSRTTAKEISSAEQQNSLLNSVQLTLFSTHIREIYSFVWPIVQSRALQNLFPFLQYIPADESGTLFVNDEAKIKQQYDLRAAGDVDVIQRAEKLGTYKEFWPIVQQTSVGVLFLQDMLRIAFPDVGDKYATALENAQQDKQLIAQLTQALSGFVQANPQVMASLSPEDKQNMQMLLQQVQQSQASV